MSYSINLQTLKTYTNHSADFLFNDSVEESVLRELLIGAGYTTSQDDLSFDELKDLTFELEGEIRDSFEPNMTFVQVAQREIPQESINSILADLTLNAPVVLLSDENQEVFFFGITAGGIDVTDANAYAYLKTDGHIPKNLLDNLNGPSTVSANAWVELSLYKESPEKYRQYQEKKYLAEATKKANRKTNGVCKQSQGKNSAPKKQ